MVANPMHSACCCCGPSVIISMKLDAFRGCFSNELAFRGRRSILLLQRLLNTEHSFSLPSAFSGLPVRSLRAGPVSTSALCHHRKREPQPGGRAPHPSRRYRLPHQQPLQVFAQSHTHTHTQTEHTHETYTPSSSSPTSSAIVSSFRFTEPNLGLLLVSLK